MAAYYNYNYNFNDNDAYVAAWFTDDPGGDNAPST